jgi:hypothetical protein
MSDLSLGPGHSASYQELILTANAGTLRLPLYQGEADARRQKPPDLKGNWSSGFGNQKDVPRRVHTFARGAGYSRKPTGYGETTEWDGFAESRDMCLRFGYGIPSGEQTASTPTAAWGKIQKILGFNGDLFFIFLTVIAYKSGGTGALTSLYARLDTDTFTDAEIWNGSLRVATVCAHGNPNQHFFVTLTPGGAPYTIINPTPAAPAGTLAAALTPQCSLLQTVFWEYQGVAGYRLAAKSGVSTFQYLIAPTGDPYDPLNWGAATIVGESSFPILQLVSSHDTLWIIKNDGVYAVTDANASAGGENITPYWRDQLDAGLQPPTAYYFLDKLVVGRPLGIEAIDVNSWQVQDRPNPVDLSFGRPNDSTINGRYTALGSDSGWLLAAMETLGGAAVVLYGTPRHRESPVAGITEYDWFPEIGPIASRVVTALQVFTPSSTLRPTLWLGLQDSSSNPYLISVDLFRGASPIADTSHRYQTTADVTFTDEQWASRVAAKGALVGTVACRNINSATGNKLDVYVTPEAGNVFPGTPSMSATVTGTTVAHAGLHNAINRAQVVRSKITLTGTATVPTVLDEWELRANLGYPLRRRGTWLVELSDASAGDLPDTTIETDTYEVLLVTLAEGMETVTATLPDGNTAIVVLDNIVSYFDESRPTSGRRVRVFEISFTQVS